MRTIRDRMVRIYRFLYPGPLSSPCFIFFLSPLLFFVSSSARHRRRWGTRAHQKRVFSVSAVTHRESIDRFLLILFILSPRLQLPCYSLSLFVSVEATFSIWGIPPLLLVAMSQSRHPSISTGPLEKNLPAQRQYIHIRPAYPKDPAPLPPCSACRLSLGISRCSKRKRMAVSSSPSLIGSPRIS